MKATELQIGNYVLDDTSDDVMIVSRIENVEYTEWNSGDKYNIICLHLGTKDYYEGNFRPIPLTEEWLEKFGFEEDETYISEQNPFLDYLKDELRISMPYFIFEYGDNGHPHIKHVHQLQNLYFCLYGEELTIKE